MIFLYCIRLVDVSLVWQLLWSNRKWLKQQIAINWGIPQEIDGDPPKIHEVLRGVLGQDECWSLGFSTMWSFPSMGGIPKKCMVFFEGAKSHRSIDGWWLGRLPHVPSWKPPCNAKPTIWLANVSLVTFSQKTLSETGDIIYTTFVRKNPCWCFEPWRMVQDGVPQLRLWVFLKPTVGYI